MAFGRRQLQAAEQTKSEPATVADTAGAAVLPEWEYDETTDAMTGQKTKHASITSNNPFLLPFPYNHGTHLRLILMRSIRLSAGFVLTNGQYAPGSGALMFSSKVDDHRVINWTAKRTNVQGFGLIEMPVQFINELRPGRTLKMQIELWQAGHRVFDFNCSGLDDGFR